MKIKTFLVDAFTDVPFKGNPAGICMLDTPISEAQMQNIAMEINAAETAFLTPVSENHYLIRYFTPTVEIPLCGHATLGSAKLLFETFGLSEVAFTTHFDLSLKAFKVAEGVEMHFPLYGTVPFEPSEQLLNSLGIKNPKTVRFCEPIQKLLIEVEDLETLKSLKPDFNAAMQCPDQLKSVSVTCSSLDHDYDFYSRMFGPWVGIDEDPVTGVAHTMLAKYWSDKLGKTELKAYQASKRGGYLNLKITDEQNLQIRSQAVIVLEGILHI